MAKNKVVKEIFVTLGQGFEEARQETESSDNPHEMISKNGWKGYYWLLLMIKALKRIDDGAEKVSKKEIFAFLEGYSLEDRRLMHSYVLMIKMLKNMGDGVVWEYFSDIDRMNENFLEEKEIPEGYLLARNPMNRFDEIMKEEDFVDFHNSVRKLFQQTTFPPVMKRKKTNGK